MGSRFGVLKASARRIGISFDKYLARVRAGEKYCWRCRSWKPSTAFNVDRSKADGHTASCQSCRRKPKQLRLIRPTPAEDARLRYATDPEHRFRRRQHSHSRQRSVAPLPIEGRDALLEKFNGCCAYCGGPAETWDHIVPVSQGGRTEPGNVLPACRSCNSKKKDRHVEDFIESAGIVISTALEAELALAVSWGRLE